MAKKKKKKWGNKRAKTLPNNVIRNKVLAFLDSNRGKSYSHKQLSRKLQIANKLGRAHLSEALTELVNEGTILLLKNNTFAMGQGASTDTSPFITGVVDFVNPRFAYIVSEETEEDTWISIEHLGDALDKDTVKVELFRRSRGRSPEGKIVEILSRGRDTYVGTLDLSDNFAFVIPDSRRMHYDIYVDPQSIKGAKDGEKVVVKITQWPRGERKPEGTIEKVLGEAGKNETEIHAIMAEYGLPMEFPKSVEKAAEKLPKEITAEEVKKRRDMRKITTFTVDPDDAKDFDDALSVNMLDNGNVEVGIHIADVSHYIEPESILDKEAIERATSVYLVDRTVPMLPEVLSNELCSLRPHEDKLTFSAVFELTPEAEIKKEWFGRTVIHSDRRFTYEDAQKVIETGKGDYADEVTLLNKLAKKMQQKRFKSGSIVFETIEVKFKLDEEAKPIGVTIKERKDAHKMIEDFMLLANKRVAEYVYNKNKGDNPPTMVYRTHDNPDTEKLKIFALFAKKFGYNFHPEEGNIAKNLNKIAFDTEGTAEQNILQNLAIRSMAKAVYSTEPKGHFGLGFAHYTHFTSPIRRYPDVMVHRLLQHYLDNGKSAPRKVYEKKCEHCSKMEKLSSDAERASIKFKQAEYMKTMIGQEFDGIVSGISEYGFYVEMIDNRCEGMVRLSDLKDDFYFYEEDKLRIIGKRFKKTISFGEKVRVEVRDADIMKRIVDLDFVEKVSS